MASFKDLKARLQGKEIPQPPVKTIPNTISSSPPTTLELEEVRYLLALIAKSDFMGKDIQIVYNVALKLQNKIKSYIEKENGDTEG